MIKFLYKAVIEYRNRSKSARNELYGRFDLGIENLGRFAAHFQHCSALVSSIFSHPVRQIVTVGVLGDVSYVKLDVI